MNFNLEKNVNLIIERENKIKKIIIRKKQGGGKRVK
jgi:hypothetical protein